MLSGNYWRFFSALQFDELIEQLEDGPVVVAEPVLLLLRGQLGIGLHLRPAQAVKAKLPLNAGETGCAVAGGDSQGVHPSVVERESMKVRR